jgi:hypothetical protein
MCEDAGFSKVQTFIASGNVVFESKASASKVKCDLEARLLAYADSPIGVVVRTAAEMAAVLKANPFPKAAPSHTVTIFLGIAGIHRNVDYCQFQFSEVDFDGPKIRTDVFLIDDVPTQRAFDHRAHISDAGI